MPLSWSIVYLGTYHKEGAENRTAYPMRHVFRMNECLLVIKVFERLRGTRAQRAKQLVTAKFWFNTDIDNVARHWTTNQWSHQLDLAFSDLYESEVLTKIRLAVNS